MHRIDHTGCRGPFGQLPGVHERERFRSDQKEIMKVGRLVCLVMGHSFGEQRGFSAQDEVVVEVERCLGEPGEPDHADVAGRGGRTVPPTQRRETPVNV